MNCRHCKTPLSHVFLDLDSAPPSNAYLTETALREPEVWYPLRVFVCDHCRLVQTEDIPRYELLFSADYAYFSSYSDTWLQHAAKYFHEIIDRFHLTKTSRIIEVASNDGYLLQYFQNNHIPCLGIEPTHGPACAAQAKGIDTIEEFFTTELAEDLLEKGWAADLLIANNVLAHVPAINDFVRGFSILLKNSGIATFEFPHLLSLVQNNQFDTIYHEHFSYFSLTTVDKIFSHNGLTIFDVERLDTHGGSLRVYAQRSDSDLRVVSRNVKDIIHEEQAAGVNRDDFYDGMQPLAEGVKYDLMTFLVEAKRRGSKVAAYGAAAKGNTLLNYAGIRGDLIEFVVDRNPAKQGKFLPGSRIPIVDESVLQHKKPNHLLILPWNLQFEIIKQLHYIRQWGGGFVTAIPSLKML